MFVTNLLADWWGRQESNRNVEQDGSTYKDFLDHQKTIWIPSELYEKCCPRFLVGGVSQRNKKGQFVCVGKCCKIHPTIMLYFDAAKSCTIATLSYRLDPFVRYLDRRVQDGSAVVKSPYYYELDGYVRDNLHRLRYQQRLFGGHFVKVAIGALKESDAAQSKLLEEAHLRQLMRRHRPCNLSSNSFSDKESASACVALGIEPRSHQGVERLEMALEICRLWGLGDHLDVLSIDCMLKTSHFFRQLAVPMAEERVNDCEFVVTPLVDGHYTSGYSVFRRGNDDQPRIFEREHGRLVEYAVCPSVLYCQKRYGSQAIPSGKCMREINKGGRYFPSLHSSVDFRRSSNRNEKVKPELPTGFSWACEELSFANLELECMDIGLREYIGQKINIQWRRTEVDDPGFQRDYSSFRDEKSTGSSDTPEQVFCVKLGWAPTKNGIVDISVPHFGVKLHIPRNSMSQVDDVTFTYKGTAQVLECKSDFTFLVAAYARSLQPYLIARHQQIETHRPLLRHEQEYFEEVQKAASLCHLSRTL
ncbi:unnamed protein product [Pseudo-nitzschia multistriata]|uniref:Uncharacterized protein n=1 Tax=Pseudo-nitzschia multistriata TaxID=183589 RepID=A0A448Z437_9STRA|nr:unnamed protein product [Pseudo-nitzschia multistriata]